MYISLFTDEFGEDIYNVLPVVAKWGMRYVDFRGLIGGKPIEYQTDEELRTLKRTLDGLGLRTGVIQSSLCKVNLPGPERVGEELHKLEGVIRASEILECRRVRSFHFWQTDHGEAAVGELIRSPERMERVAEMFEPFRKRAREAGLILGFENCGETADEVIAFLNYIGEPDWGLAWDVWNDASLLPEARGECEEYYLRALKYTNMIHVKANCISDIPELDYVKVPWDRILSAAAALKKEIPVSIETHNPGDGPLAGKNGEVTKRIYDYLVRIWPSEIPESVEEALSCPEEH